MPTEIVLSDSSRVNAHRQIATQIAARILTGELGAGRRVPSGRAMARRLRVHRSVVAGAYRQLSGWGLVRSAPGSGMFVTGEPPTPLAARGSLRGFLEARRSRGSSLADTADLLRQWMRTTNRRGILVVERETALRSLLAGELRSTLEGVHVGDLSLAEALRDSATGSGNLIVAQRGLVAPLQAVLPPWVEILPIRFRSPNPELLASEPTRGSCAVAICTRSRCVGTFARGLLASTYGDRVGLLQLDPADRPGVARANRICRWIFSDTACSAELLATLRSSGNGTARVRVIRLVAPRFIAELSRYILGSARDGETRRSGT
jgi:DNA-binding transcriptional regulator YhcF (GntR family)